MWEPAQLWDFLQDYLALLYGLSSRPDQLHLFLHRLSPLEIFTATVGALSSILTGVVAAVSAKGFAKLLHYKFYIFTYSLSGILASLTNTFLVLGGIYLFFGQSYASALGIAYEALLGAIGLTILTNGIPEAVVAAITSYAIAYPIRKYVMKDPNLRQIKEKK